MPRKTRLHVDGGIYHVILRGNARKPIFFRKTDRSRLNELVAESLERYQCRLHAFCWMTNHLHAAIQVSNQPLSGFMCWLGSRYARYINRCRGRSGHLFERRHRAELVTDDEYLLSLIRYIHCNPVTAGLVTDPGKYLWSSHKSYLGTEILPWVTTRPVLSCFADSIPRARQQYRQFMAISTDWTPSADELSHNHNDDPLRADELAMPGMKSLVTSDIAARLNSIVNAYCAISGIDPAMVTGPGRLRNAARVRGVICDRALSSGAATLAELAAHFGRAPEVISRGIARYGDAASRNE